MKIHPSLIKIENLSNNFYVVPDYQREYVWKYDEHIEQFLDDIHQSAYNKDDSYFIGSMITVRRADGRYDIIDGQQRLTTIVLCLCAITNVLKNFENEEPRIIQIREVINQLLYKYDIANDIEQVRLELQYEESRDILSYIIKSSTKGVALPKDFDVTASSVWNICFAYANINQYYYNLIQQDISDAIDEIRHFLTKVEMVVIETEDLGSALKIFETINQRGVGLNAMDLTKNLLFINADGSEYGKIKAIWKSISETLRSCKEDDKPMRFMRYFFIARYTSDVITEERIYKWLTSEEGSNLVNYTKAPIAFAKELQNAAKRYARLVSATEKFNNKLPHVYNIGLINKKRSRQHLILLLALHQDATDDVIEFLAEKIESYFFYAVSLRIQAKHHEKFFTRVAQELRGKKTIEEIKPIINKTLGTYVAKQINDFKHKFLALRTDIFKPDYRLRYVLGKINNQLCNLCGLNNITNFSTYEQFEIEHILPQTPKDNYVGDWGNIDDYRTDVYLLGNVTLLEGQINKAVNKCNDLSSEWFEKKQREYIHSSLTITRLLSTDFTIGNNTALNRYRLSSGYSFEKWNKESIARRQKIFLNLAMEVWHFDTLNEVHNDIDEDKVNVGIQPINTYYNDVLFNTASFLGTVSEVEHTQDTNPKVYSTKSPRKNIRIIFPDGTIIQNSTATDSLIEFIQIVGIDRVRSLGLTRCNIPLISNTIDKKYGNSQKELGNGLYLITNTTTAYKILDIERISAAYNLGVKIEIV